MKLFFTILICVALFSCASKEPKKRVLQGNAFGTTYTIQFFSQPDSMMNSEDFSIEKGIDSVIHRVNKSVSTYMPNSDISKVNRGDTTVIVDNIFKEVFRISETVYTNSQGYFDPTIGVLRNAYGFGDVKPIKVIDSIVLDSLMKFVGFKKVFISKTAKVVKQYPEIYFDFNAVAKGYGIDCLGNYLESKNIENYIIELGGEVLAKGKNLEKQKWWTAGVESVSSQLENRSAIEVVVLKNKAMAGSGNYRKFRVDSVSGKKYVHTLNPLTGSAEQSDVTSATVIASSCGEADAYATALMALGLKKSIEMLKVTDAIEAYLTYTDSLNIEQVYKTEGFEKLLVQ